MSFAVRNMSVLAYANGFTLWHFKSGADTLDTITTDGYFNNSSDMLTVGDMVMITGQDGGRVVIVAFADDVVVVKPLS